MKHLVTSALLVATVAVLAGCPVPGALIKSPPGDISEAPVKRKVTASVVTGRVLAPANLIGQAGGNVIATGGGNVIATGGLNVIATGGGNFKTHQAGETLISGAEVFLADAGSNPFPSLPTVKSTAEGKYTIPNVPADFTYMVVVRFKTSDGKTGQLQTLVRSTKLGATADVGAATTLVTAAAVGRAQRALGELDPASFSRAVATVNQHATKDKLPNWTDASAVTAAIDRIKAEVAELSAQLETIQRDIEKLQASIDEINDRIDELQKSPSPSPSAAVTPTPSPGVSAAASPVVSPSASTAVSAPPTTGPTPGAGPKFDLDAQYSADTNPNGSWEYMWRNAGDWQKMRPGTNLGGRPSWIARDLDSTVVFPGAFIENTVAGDGWVNLKPQDDVPAGFRWTAPQDGLVRIEVGAQLERTVGNGVTVTLMTDGGPGTGGKTTLKNKLLEPTKGAIQVVEDVDVKAGHRIYLLVTANDEGTGDQTRMRAMLTY